MATVGKKRTTTKARRKPGATKKRKARVGESAVKIKIAGSTFTQSSCHTSKTAAKSKAESARSAGTRARVIKSGTHFCVYTGGKSKALARRKRA